MNWSVISLILILTIPPTLSFVDKTKIEFFFDRWEQVQVSKIVVYDLSELVYKKRRGEGKFTGSVNFLTDIDDNLEFHTIIYKMEGNEYRLTPFKYKRTKFCEMIKTADEYYKQLPENSEIPTGCPVPKGNYKVDWKPDFSNSPPVFQGKYRVNLTAYYKNEVNCVVVFYIELQRYTVD